MPRMRRVLVFSGDAVAPVSATVDLTARLAAGYCNSGPMLASICYWTQSAHVRPDPENDPAGGYELKLRWMDPTGRVRQVDVQTISLNDPDALFSSPLQQINRLSGESLLEVVTGAANAGTSRVSYRIALLPSVPSDLVYLPLT